mmetsp:Transcript_39882/g.93168  ORF Transcript_39882/g.93168 Transcript_39882/m.93168 type:complete len:97 (+) Transcript_39882:133-423(+)
MPGMTSRFERHIIVYYAMLQMQLGGIDGAKVCDGVTAAAASLAITAGLQCQLSVALHVGDGSYDGSGWRRWRPRHLRGDGDGSGGMENRRLRVDEI